MLKSDKYINFTVDCTRFFFCCQLSKWKIQPHNKMTLVILGCVLYSCFIGISNSAVTLDVIPPEIHIGQTDSLEVICRVDKGDSPNVVFSITLHHSSLADVQDFSYLASVNSFDGQVRKGFPDLKITSGVVDNSGESHLRLKWKVPTLKRTGVYRCDVTAMDAEGKPVAISKTATVNSSNDDTDGLVKIFENFTPLYQQSVDMMTTACENTSRELVAVKNETLRLESSMLQFKTEAARSYERVNSELQNSVHDLTNLLDSVKQDFSIKINEINSQQRNLLITVKANGNRTDALVSDLAKLQEELKAELSEVKERSRESLQALQDTVQPLIVKIDKATNASESYRKEQIVFNGELQSQINTLRSLHTASHKIEVGSYYCGEFVQNFPTALDGNKKAEDVVVTYRNYFPKPPTVIQYAVLWDVMEGKNFRLLTEVHNQTTSGFVGRCVTWGDTIIYRVKVNWVAIGVPSS
ncbi:hypothetical protein Btru_077463 [Bulinus truncatus]|nr:hypothetical protein Btru_077463 [Bulinus truncatus]